MRVPSINKERYTACPHLAAPPARGCSIYGSHPDECRGYRCGWLEAGDHGFAGEDLIREEERPDRSGLIAAVSGDDVTRELGAPLLSLHEVWEGAASLPRGMRIIARMVRKGMVVCVVWRDSRVLYGSAAAMRRANSIMRAHGYSGTEMRTVAIDGGRIR